MEDMSIEKEDAVRVMRESASYGVEMFPYNDDLGYTLVDHITIRRAAHFSISIDN